MHGEESPSGIPGKCDAFPSTRPPAPSGSPGRGTPPRRGVPYMGEEKKKKKNEVASGVHPTVTQFSQSRHRVHVRQSGLLSRLSHLSGQSRSFPVQKHVATIILYT